METTIDTVEALEESLDILSAELLDERKRNKLLLKTIKIQRSKIKELEQKVLALGSKDAYGRITETSK